MTSRARREDGDQVWSENYDGAVMVMSARCWLLVRANKVAALVDRVQMTELPARR